MGVLFISCKLLIYSLNFLHECGRFILAIQNIFLLYNIYSLQASNYRYPALCKPVWTSVWHHHSVNFFFFHASFWSLKTLSCHISFIPFRPVIIEVPHFASLRGREIEIVILRRILEYWKEHQLDIILLHFAFLSFSWVVMLCSCCIIFILYRPVIIEVPHFASLRGREREIVILRSEDGEHWKEHPLDATEDSIQEALGGSFEGEGDSSSTREACVVGACTQTYFFTFHCFNPFNLLPREMHTNTDVCLGWYSLKFFLEASYS